MKEIFTFLATALAQPIDKVIPPEGRFNDINDLIVHILNWIIGFLGILAVVAIFYSGIMYITAGGDATKAETARKNLTWAITGIVIAALSWAVVNFIVDRINTP